MASRYRGQLLLGGQSCSESDALAESKVPKIFIRPRPRYEAQRLHGRARPVQATAAAPAGPGAASARSGSRFSTPAGRLCVRQQERDERVDGQTLTALELGSAAPQPGDHERADRGEDEAEHRRQRIETYHRESGDQHPPEDLKAKRGARPRAPRGVQRICVVDGLADGVDTSTVRPRFVHRSPQAPLPRSGIALLEEPRGALLEIEATKRGERFLDSRRRNRGDRREPNVREGPGEGAEDQSRRDRSDDQNGSR